MPRALKTTVNVGGDTLSLMTLTGKAAGTYATAVLPNVRAVGCIVFINVTAQTGTVTVTINAHDAFSGAYVPMLTSAALASPAATMMQVAPGIGAVTNLAVPLYLPAGWQVSVVIGAGAAVTGSISAQYVDVSENT